MTRRHLDGIIPDSDDPDCRTSIGDRNCEYIYVQLQSYPLIVVALNREVWVCVDLPDAQLPCARPRNIAHRIHVVRNSEKLDRCACIVGALHCLGDKWSLMWFDHTYKRWILSSSRADNLLGGTIAHTDGHSQASYCKLWCNSV